MFSLGRWLKINGQAIYKTKPWKLQNDTVTSDVWYTQGQSGEVYAILLSWPKDNVIHLSPTINPTAATKITILGNTLKAKVSNKTSSFQL